MGALAESFRSRSIEESNPRPAAVHHVWSGMLNEGVKAAA